MCGIVGLLARQEPIRQALGQFLVPMLSCMGDRGPDSAGLALFGNRLPNGLRRYSLFSSDPACNWRDLCQQFALETASEARIEAVASHAELTSALAPGDVRGWLTRKRPDLHLLSVGHAISVIKDEGHPAAIAQRYGLMQLAGTHAVGHTRMATESAVSPAHAHPFTAGEDFCLVHNGSLSNPHSVRRMLERKGIRFETDNDTEAACRFLEWRMREGDSLEEAIAKGFTELDGFFTLLMATADTLVLVRDPFACKPAVVAETDQYVAIGSEFRALAHLPGVDCARIFEPEPERIYAWSV
jgi:glutamate synthase domain-containing protein 1